MMVESFKTARKTPLTEQVGNAKKVNRFRTHPGKTTEKRYMGLKGHRYDCQPTDTAKVKESLIIEVGSGKESITEEARWYHSIRGVPYVSP